MSSHNPIMYFNTAGWPFMALSAGATLVLSFAEMPALCVVSAILTTWVFYFFRDPNRVTPVRPGLIVSPADGRVVAVQEVVPEAEFGLGDEPRVRISIFLNIFNVHVNRMPADGTVVSCKYRKGKFFNAALDKASTFNERMAITLRLTGKHPKNGDKIGFVQIAGLIARRIVCHAKEGETVKAGKRYGIIRFGSRADVYLPVGVASRVIIGQTMIGGETILADCASEEDARRGEIRE